MKPLNLLSILFICALVINCDDEKADSQTNAEVVHVTLKNTETHNHDFGQMGIEDGASLEIEPQHALMSTLGRNNDNHLIYTYQPTDDFTGTDKVQIKLCHSPGNATCYSTELVTIHFTVTN